jgi:hypothetical protein
MKFRFISDHRETFKVGRMCTLLNVSRSGFYAGSRRPESRRSRENRSLGGKIRVYHAASHGIYGSPKIHQDLTDDGVKCGKNRVARIMREAGIRSGVSKRNSKRRPTHATAYRWPRICLIKTSRPKRRTVSGLVILPMSPPRKAGCIWPF